MSTNRSELRLVVDTYKFYYSRIAKVENFIFKMTPTRAVMIDNFIEKFKEINQTKLLQEQSLTKFMEYQFNYWYKKDSKYGVGKSIQLEWIIGKQAIERWVKLNKKNISYVIRKNIKKDHNLVKKVIKNPPLNYLLDINKIEELNKSKFLNTELGFESCFLLTNLYNHKSNTCLKCDFKKGCKDRLKEFYPKIFKLRGYE